MRIARLTLLLLVFAEASASNAYAIAVDSKIGHGFREDVDLRRDAFLERIGHFPCADHHGDGAKVLELHGELDGTLFRQRTRDDEVLRLDFTPIALPELRGACAVR